jgi:hypothetical protein
MAGILPDVARKTYAIPADWEAVTGMAIGYAADTERDPEPLRQRDLAPRTRKRISEFVFSGQWQVAAKL